MIIDSHCHIGSGARKVQSAEELIERMDQEEVDVSVVCPIEECIAVDNAYGIQLLCDAVKRYPDRLIGMPAITPWSGEKGVKLLIEAYESGLKGLKFNPSLQGFLINSDIVEPLIDVVAHYKNGPIYVHSGTMDYSMPYDICELASRHPEVDFILGHCGNIDVFWGLTCSIQGRPALANTYVECSHVCFISGLEDQIKQYGPERFLFGSDSPQGSLKLELNKVKEFGFNQDGKHRMLGGNMAKLLKLQ